MSGERKEYKFLLPYARNYDTHNCETYYSWLGEGFATDEKLDEDAIETKLAKNLSCEPDEENFSTHCATLPVPSLVVSRIQFDALHEYVVRKGVKPTDPVFDPYLSKEELRDQLLLGRKLSDILCITDGQECNIVKADDFLPGDKIIYIPDLRLNNIPENEPITNLDTLDDVIGNCYTGDDFIKECGGDREKAKLLFHYVDWQHPISAIDELEDDEPESSTSVQLTFSEEEIQQLAKVAGMDIPDKESLCQAARAVIDRACQVCKA